MNPEHCRALFASQPVARLATVGAAGPHLVPVVFAVEGDRIVTAIDHKPKRTERLQRLLNIEADPAVAVLADHYEDDWTRLWWVRADGAARILGEGADWSAAIDLLAAKYAHYLERPPSGPVIEITVARWSGWLGSP
jgi:PPOX class probable F420-dependent enzyme